MSVKLNKSSAYREYTVFLKYNVYPMPFLSCCLAQIHQNNMQLRRLKNPLKAESSPSVLAEIMKKNNIIIKNYCTIIPKNGVACTQEPR